MNQMNVNGVFHHPTFLYESLWSIVGVILLLVIRRMKFVRAGEMFAFYFIWYSIGRFFIERVRTDSLAFQGPDWLASFVNALWSPMVWLGFEPGYLDPSYGNVRISQLLAIFIIVAAVIFILVRRRKGSAVAKYSDPIVSSKTGIDQVPDVTPEQVSRPGQDTVSPTAATDKLSKEDTDEDKKEHL